MRNTYISLCSPTLGLLKTLLTQLSSSGQLFMPFNIYLNCSAQGEVIPYVGYSVCVVCVIIVILSVLSMS